MKKRNLFKKLTAFAAGMVTMAVLTVLVVPTFASGNQIAFNQVGIRTFGVQRIEVGEQYIAPNGQQVPSSITYTDATGGKTNYLSVRQICELLDATVAWNSEENSVDIAGPIKNDVTITSGTGKEEAEPDLIFKPEYGKIVGGIEEIDPATVADIINDTAYRSRSYASDLNMRFSLSDIPGFAVKHDPQTGPYMVFTVTNNGTSEVYSTVRRDVTISYGRSEKFTSVAVPAGETLVRVFRVSGDAHPLQTTLTYDVRSVLDRDNPDNNVTVSLEKFYDSLDFLED